jgi:hypothetical protein
MRRLTISHQLGVLMLGDAGDPDVFFFFIHDNDTVGDRHHARERSALVHTGRAAELGFQ